MPAALSDVTGRMATRSKRRKSVAGKSSAPRRARRSSHVRLRAPDVPDVTPPEGSRVSRFRVGEDEIVVLSFPLMEPELPATLTAAERGVLELLLRGRSNSEIAAARGTSARTVANQVASIFRKLGVSSRAELSSKLSK